jgi:hypothetical protein
MTKNSATIAETPTAAAKRTATVISAAAVEFFREPGRLVNHLGIERVPQRVGNRVLQLGIERGRSRERAPDEFGSGVGS